MASEESIPKLRLRLPPIEFLDKVALGGYSIGNWKEHEPRVKRGAKYLDSRFRGNDRRKVLK